MKKVCIGLIILLIGGVANGQRKGKSRITSLPMEAQYWSAVTDNVEFITYKSIPAVRSKDGKGFRIMSKNMVFVDGTIEFDVEFKGPGFPGIEFRIDKDTLNSEIFYIRYFGTPDDLKRTTLQYAPILDGVNMWDVTDDYQAAATIYEGKWNHVKLVVYGKQMKVYVNDMQRAALQVPAFEGITDGGTIALTGNVVYANFTVRPNATEDLDSNEGYDSTHNDPRYLRNWLVSGTFDFPFGKGLMTFDPSTGMLGIDPVLLDSTVAWEPITAGRRALVNLTRLFGHVELGQKKLAWIKTTITSERDQEKKLDLGFSDEVWVFINGQPLYIDKNYFGTPSMKQPKGRCTIENSSFPLPLQKGENEILIGVANYFYGWGIIARIKDTEGLKFK